MVHIHGQEVPRDTIYHALVNYADIFYDLRYLLATKTDAIVHSYYTASYLASTIGNRFSWNVMAPECLQGCTVSWLLL